MAWHREDIDFEMPCSEVWWHHATPLYPVRLVLRHLVSTSPMRRSARILMAAAHNPQVKPPALNVQSPDRAPPASQRGVSPLACTPANPQDRAPHHCYLRRNLAIRDHPRLAALQAPANDLSECQSECGDTVQAPAAGRAA